VRQGHPGHRAQPQEHTDVPRYDPLVGAYVPTSEWSILTQGSNFAAVLNMEGVDWCAP
jgi:hypothetical protein